MTRITERELSHHKATKAREREYYLTPEELLDDDDNLIVFLANQSTLYMYLRITRPSVEPLQT